MRFGRWLGAWFGCLPLAALGAPQEPAVSGPGIRVELALKSGLPVRIQSSLRTGLLGWLHGPVRLSLENELSHRTGRLLGAGAAASGGVVSLKSRMSGLPVQVEQRFSPSKSGIDWTLSFTSQGPRVGHTLTIELPILAKAERVFTPSQRGVMDLAAYPSFEHVPYGSVAWTTGETYVLPLVSVMDVRRDRALTLALRPDDNIPHFQVSWAKGVLKLQFAHRGIEKGKAMKVRLMLFSHAADYRAAMKAYSDRFPAYFRPGLPRSEIEGTFYYHHIQDHPDFEEMARQSVRYIWSSFWFTHLGEYLPDATEWEPYTYNRWWRLKQPMSDAKINAFVQELQDHGIGTYAYFNVTEFGGAGGKSGEQTTADLFADALIKDSKGKRIPTWEGAMAMNPGSRYSLWPVLEDQVARHLRRLPGIRGFIIDRLDWASTLDFGHDDGLTTLGTVRAENMAMPVAEAVQGVCRLAHAARKRVFVNQYYRIEPLRDTDGTCHECDYLPGLGYLTPLRPASAWHQQKPYSDDLLTFEAHLKQRLHWALFPQMIAHEYPISQQAAEPRAADLLEIYRPLFDTLIGKEQVLLPHCVSVSGRNAANLFGVPGGRYVAAVTSHDRFLVRGDRGSESVRVTVRVPDARRLRWAEAISADASPLRLTLRYTGGSTAMVDLPSHRTATMILLGSGQEPAVKSPEVERLDRLRAARFPIRLTPIISVTVRPILAGVLAVRLSFQGRQVGASGIVRAIVGGRPMGQFSGAGGTVAIGKKLPSALPKVELREGDEGTWFVQEKAELLADTKDGKTYCVARSERGGPLRWIAPIAYAVQSVERDSATVGAWQGRYGNLAAWIAGSSQGPQNGYLLETGSPFVWAERTDDTRVPQAPDGGGSTKATCWFASESLPVRVTPPNDKPYFVGLYLLDYDRNGRSETVSVVGDMGTRQQASTVETGRGVYLRWRVQGPFTAEIRKTKGFNVVLSAVFVDPAPPKQP